MLRGWGGDAALRPPPPINQPEPWRFPLGSRGGEGGAAGPGSPPDAQAGAAAWPGLTPAEAHTLGIPHATRSRRITQRPVDAAGNTVSRHSRSSPRAHRRQITRRTEPGCCPRAAGPVSVRAPSRADPAALGRDTTSWAAVLQGEGAAPWGSAHAAPPTPNPGRTSAHPAPPTPPPPLSCPPWSG